MRLWTGIFNLLFFLCIYGCTSTKYEVWKEKDVSFASFNAIEVGYIFNATGKPFTRDYLTLLKIFLNEQFKINNLKINNNLQTKKGVLSVETDILVLDAMNPSKSSSHFIGTKSYWSKENEKALCTLSTRLIDKSTTQVVARISMTVVAGKDIYSGSDVTEFILRKSAKAIVDEVAKILQKKVSS